MLVDKERKQNYKANKKADKPVGWKKKTKTRQTDNTYRQLNSRSTVCETFIYEFATDRKRDKQKDTQKYRKT